MVDANIKGKHAEHANRRKKKITKKPPAKMCGSIYTKRP